MSIFNNPSHTIQRRSLRSQRSTIERLLWTKLLGKQINGHKFRKQHGIGPYFADFYCVALKLAIELDGDSHDNEASELHDSKRDSYFSSLGIKTVRILNADVIRSVDVVAEQIAAVAEQRQKEITEQSEDLP